MLAFAAGVVSYMWLPRYIQSSEEKNSEEQFNSEHCPAITPSAFFAKENLKKQVLVGVAALLCAAAAYRLAVGDLHILDICRRWGVGLLLVPAMIIDAKTHRIPNPLVLCGLGFGTVLLPFEFLFRREGFLSTLLTSVVGLLLCGLIFYIMSKLTKDGIGMGDVKLIASMGWILGFAATFTAVLLAMILCSLTAVVLLLTRIKRKNDAIPMGPFLFFGYIAMLILLG